MQINISIVLAPSYSASCIRHWLLSVWKRKSVKSVLIETNGQCKNIFLSSQHRGTNMIRCQGFLKLDTGHSVKHRCLNALSPSLTPAKAHVVASLRRQAREMAVAPIAWFCRYVTRAHNFSHM